MGDNGKAYGKLVIVGDGAVGKTCLLDRLKQGDEMQFDPNNYTPTAANNSKVETDASVNGEVLSIELDIWDTAGQEALASLRTAAYPDTQILLIAFSMDADAGPASLSNVKEFWMPEFEEFGNDSAWAIVLVGCKKDMWFHDETKSHDDNEAARKEKNQPTLEAIKQVAKEINATCTIFTSAFNGYGVRDYVDEDCEYEMPFSEMEDKTLLNICCSIAVNHKLNGDGDLAPAPVAPASTQTAPAPKEPAPKKAAPAKPKEEDGCCVIA